MASSITTFRVELSVPVTKSAVILEKLGDTPGPVEPAMQLSREVCPEVEPVGEGPAADPLGAVVVSPGWPDCARESSWLDVDVPAELNVVTGLRRLQQLKAHEDPAVGPGGRQR